MKFYTILLLSLIFLVIGFNSVEGEKKDMAFNEENIMFNESTVIKGFPVPNTASLADKAHKYAIYELNEEFNLSNFMGTYLIEIEKWGWIEIKEKNNGQIRVFEKEGRKVQISFSTKNKISILESQRYYPQ